MKPGKVVEITKGEWAGHRGVLRKGLQWGSWVKLDNGEIVWVHVKSMKAVADESSK